MTDTDMTGLISMCCDAPTVGEIDIDSVDGLYGEPWVVYAAECSECHKMSGVHDA